MQSDIRKILGSLLSFLAAGGHSRISGGSGFDRQHPNHTKMPNQSLERTPFGLPVYMGMPSMVSLSSRR